MSKPNVFVVAIDTQVDFVMADGLLSVPGAEAIIAPGIRFLAGLDPDEVAGVLFTHDTHEREVYMGSDENVGDEAAGIPGFPLHCEYGTPGWVNVFNPSLVPDAIPVHTLTKGVFDMWAEPVKDEEEEDDGAGWINHIERNGSIVTYCTSTTREAFFGEPGATPDTAAQVREMGVDTIRIIGVASDYCVKWAIQGFLDLGYRVEVVGDLTAGIQRDIERTVVEDFTGRVLVV